MRAKQPDQMKERNKELGELMREARTSKGETVKRCAEEYLGISRERYDLMEAGKANIGWVEFAYLMEKLGISEEWLLPRMSLRGLLFGTGLDTKVQLSSAVPGRRDQGDRAQTGENMAGVESVESVESVENGGGQLLYEEHSAHGNAAAGAASAGSAHAKSASASSHAPTPPIPTYTPEHLLLPLTPGYGYTVQVLDADGAVVYSMDWALPRRRKIRTARLRPVASATTAHSKTSATARM